MASFRDQFEAARSTNLVVRAVESASRSRVQEIFQLLAQGQLSTAQAATELEKAVRSAYRSSVALGTAHLAAQAGLPRWKPDWESDDANFNPPYLRGLLADVQRNFGDFAVAERTVESTARAVSRISHSAGVAAARGHTDALVLTAREMSVDHGFSVLKVWQANFLNHTPCVLCASLHDTSVPVSESFPSDNGLKVYGDLKGPPRHPRCMCWLVILIEGLDNLGEDPVATSQAEDRDTLSTEQVKEMPAGFFLRIVRWLRQFVRSLRRDL